METPTKPVRIAIADTSTIIRRGLGVLLEETDPVPFVVSEIGNAKELDKALDKHFDILILNPLLTTELPLEKIKKRAANPQMKCVVMLRTLADPVDENGFDESISLFDPADCVREKLIRLVVPDYVATGATHCGKQLSQMLNHWFC
jgi:DNA-binding NarL/FixJ family response regulator